MLRKALRVLDTVWAEHRPILALAALQLVAGGLWLAWYERPWHLRFYYGFLWRTWFVLTVLWLFWQYLRSPQRVRGILRPERVAGALIVVALVAPFQSTFQSLKRAIPAFTWDRTLSGLDVALHGSPPWTWWVPSDLALFWIDKVYELWFFLIVAFVVWVAWTGRRALRARVLAATMLLWIMGGSVGAWTLASGGPIFYGRIVGEPNPYAEITERMTTQILFVNGAQMKLWTVRQTGEFHPFSGISAMPSMHVAMAVLIAMAAWSRSRLVGVACWIYAASVQVGSVVLAWHYAIDGYAGTLLAVGCWWAAPRYLALFQRQPQQPDAADSYQASPDQRVMARVNQDCA